MATYVRQLSSIPPAPLRVKHLQFCQATWTWRDVYFRMQADHQGDHAQTITFVGKTKIQGTEPSLSPPDDVVQRSQTVTQNREHRQGLLMVWP